MLCRIGFTGSARRPVRPQSPGGAQNEPARRLRAGISAQESRATRSPSRPTPYAGAARIAQTVLPGTPGVRDTPQSRHSRCTMNIPCPPGRPARCGVRGRGLARTPVGDLEAQHFGVGGDPQLLGPFGVQARVGDQFGDDEQDVLRGGAAVRGGGRQPAPVVERLAGEVACHRDDAAGAAQRQGAYPAFGPGGGDTRAVRLGAEIARRKLPGGAHQRFTSPIHRFANWSLRRYVVTSLIRHAA